MLTLVEPSGIGEGAFSNFIDEWGEERLVPYSIDCKGKAFKAYIQALIHESQGVGLGEGWVPASTFFLVDEDGYIYGAVNIRHRLTDGLKEYGGHIGYGIRPGQRGQGIGTRLLGLALDEARVLGLRKVLLTCDKNNPASAGVILANGGILESEALMDQKWVQRYWIDQTREPGEPVSQ